MKKPVGIIILIIMNVLEILVSLFPIVIVLAIAAMPESSEFRQGFEIGIGGSIDASMLGELIGGTTLQIGIIVVLLVAILSRKYKLTVGLMIFKVLTAFSSPFDIVWSVIMLLIVLINKNCKQYIKGSDMTGMGANHIHM